MKNTFYFVMDLSTPCNSTEVRREVFDSYHLFFPRDRFVRLASSRLKLSFHLINMLCHNFENF